MNWVIAAIVIAGCGAAIAMASIIAAESKLVSKQRRADFMAVCADSGRTPAECAFQWQIR
jgi:hypothetical protein